MPEITKADIGKTLVRKESEEVLGKIIEVTAKGVYATNGNHGTRYNPDTVKLQ